MKDNPNYSLLKHNTFGIEAKCKRFVEFESEEEISRFLLDEGQTLSPYIIIGGGSNLLLTSDYEGTVIRSAIKGVEVMDCEPSSKAEDDCGEALAEDTILVGVGSGETWDDFVALCVERGWYGAENLSGIPGDVGASAIQNIGAYGVEAKDIIHKVEVVEVSTAQKLCFTNEECQYAYRQSRFKGEWKGKYIVTRVIYKLNKTFTPILDYGNIRSRLEAEGVKTLIADVDNPTAEALKASLTDVEDASAAAQNSCSAADVRRVVIAIRDEKLPDPRVEGNAGSFFMNPVVSRDKYLTLAAQYPDMPHYTVADDMEKIPAGWMIEQCGWKGKVQGRAGVHSKQALVLVNKGGATGEEIVMLCETIRRDVFLKFGINITPEVNII